MSQKEKLIKKLKSGSQMTFDEVETLLMMLSYTKSNKGKTSGSRIKFMSDSHAPIIMHKPHPRKELLQYQINQIKEILEQENLI